MEEAQLREDLKAVEAALKKTKKVVCAVQRSSSTAVDYDYIILCEVEDRYHFRGSSSQYQAKDREGNDHSCSSSSDPEADAVHPVRTGHQALQHYSRTIILVVKHCGRRDGSSSRQTMSTELETIQHQLCALIDRNRIAHRDKQCKPSAVQATR